VGGVRHIDGASSVRLLCGTAGTCAVMLRETAKRSNLKAQSTDAQRRGGLTRSSVERSVMDLERRGQIVLPTSLSTRKGEERMTEAKSFDWGNGSPVS